jgi:naphthoate synthase
LPRIVGERLAREMIFGCRTFTGPEAVEVGLANRSVPKKDLLKVTKEFCEKIKSYSSQTIRMTKKSLNYESDQLYSSWQQGMELLAHVWGSDEAMEGMHAFLEKRKPDFGQFRKRNKVELDGYMDGLRRDINKPPAKKKPAKKETKKKAVKKVTKKTAKKKTAKKTARKSTKKRRR